MMSLTTTSNLMSKSVKNILNKGHILSINKTKFQNVRKHPPVKVYFYIYIDFETLVMF